MPATRQALTGQPEVSERVPLLSPPEAPPPLANVTLRAQEEGLHHLYIDAHWLQRKLSKYYKEATTSQKKAMEVLYILQKTADDRKCENQLVRLLRLHQDVAAASTSSRCC